jgi:murein L,D-transpeptidase YcbB/YkuD
MESIKYKPSIPLYITYYTAYPDINGNVVFTSDPYDYDQLIYSRITGMSQPLRRAE